MPHHIVVIFILVVLCRLVAICCSRRGAISNRCRSSWRAEHGSRVSGQVALCAGRQQVQGNVAGCLVAAQGFPCCLQAVPAQRM